MISTNISLLDQLRLASNTNAWSKFVRLYAPLIHQWVGKLGISEPDQSDIAQEVFLVLMEKVPSFRYRKDLTFRGWLRTITRNKCLDALRHRQRDSEPQFLEQIESEFVDERLETEQQEYRDYLAGRAIQLMRQHFSENTWRACWEHVAMGRPAKEVAADLSMTENAVYLARARILKRLRVELDGLWD